MERREVKILPKNKKFYFTILELLKEGKNPSKISKEINISKQKLNYYLRRLKQEGRIIKKGYGTWEVKDFTLNTLGDYKGKVIRGHAFIWTINIPKEKQINWEKHLDSRKIKYKKVGRGQFPRVYINKRKIWLGKKNIIIYENKSFYAENAVNSRKYAVVTLLETLQALENKLGVSLGNYKFKPSREHYGMIKNDLAIQCNRNKEKIYVRDDLEGEWLWIDDSFQLGELETGGKKAMTRNMQVQNWYNDHKKHNFKVTPSFLLENINKVTENQLMFNQNFESHIEAIKILGESVKQLQKEVKRLRDANIK